MSDSVTFDLVSVSADGQTLTGHLVENGPWDDDAAADLWNAAVARVWSALEVVVQGGLLERYPQSARQHVVVEVNSYQLPPKPFAAMVDVIEKHIQTDSTWLSGQADKLPCLSLHLRHSPVSVPVG
jgi:hypothetical protein